MAAERVELVVKLDGGSADLHYVPAFTALDSAHAISQALMMIIHFAQTGEIRRRNFKDLETEVLLKETRPGSFEFVYDFSEFAPYFVEVYGKGLSNASWKLIETVFKRATGLAGNREIEEAEGDGRFSSGDLGALIQAAEPAVRRSHSVINHGAGAIQISVVGDGNQIVLDRQSKDYMHESIFNDEARSQRFLVTSFDGRNRTGRLFDLEDEQAYTFDLLPDADRKSLTVIVDAARSYALREKGKFDEKMEAVCAFTSVDAPDGRKKRLKVFAVARDYAELDIGELPNVSDAPQRIGPEEDHDDVIE
ncbi:hypothetical protein [Oceanicola granulosus]|uniref:DUF7946 domain-containing protein n=1 Tax=Oceanicola granulosus TaxID=252302 RepID=UPI0012EAECAD|nr:hypothetical protein [Oceanicola granulosus]